jgi:hypothetical protein
MAATTVTLVKVDDFRKLPEENGVYHELRNGAVFSVTRPKYRHYTIQRRLRRLLEGLAPRRRKFTRKQSCVWKMARGSFGWSTRV